MATDRADVTSGPPASQALPRRVLVTGAASGLGLALATGLSARGDRVLATDLSTDRPLSLPMGVDYLPLDVRSDAAWAAAFAHVTKEWGWLDLLINNAGVASVGGIEVATMEEWDRVIDINLLGVVRGSRTFAPMFKTQRTGHIVNVASLAGLTPPKGMVAYSTAKAGVIALSDVVGQELGEFGVAVSAVCPFFFQSDIGDSLVGEADETEAAVRAIATLSTLTADEIAATVIKGIDARRDIILTDPQGRFLWRAQRFARPVYRWLLARGLAKTAPSRQAAV